MAALYVPSPKRYPCALRSPEYPADWEVYLVRRDGSIRVPGRDLFLSSVLVSEPVAFEPLADGSMAVRYGPLKLGTLASNGKFVRGSRRSRQDVNTTTANSGYRMKLAVVVLGVVQRDSRRGFGSRVTQSYDRMTVTHEAGSRCYP